MLWSNLLLKGKDEYEAEANQAKSVDIDATVCNSRIDFFTDYPDWKFDETYHVCAVVFIIRVFFISKQG